MRSQTTKRDEGRTARDQEAGKSEDGEESLLICNIMILL